jgi:ankyrin repeat protein
MIIINFREYFYLYESIDQNFDQWLVDLKKNARPDESEIKIYSGHMSLKRDWIERTLKSKNVENKQYMKYLIGVSTTPQSDHIEDYERAVDTLKWFIQTNRLTKAQVEADGWFNTGKRATELTREKDKILNPASKTKEKKEKKLGIAENISPLFQSGNIKIYFSPKVTNEKSKEEDAEKPEIKARHKILCKYGKDTDWCTASASGTYHAQYSDRNIYIVHIDDKPAYQFMDCTAEDVDERCQFHDAKNESAKSIPLDLALLIKEKLPKIASFYICVKNTFNKAIEDEIERGNSELIKDLIEKGAKVGDANHRAGKIRNLELIKDLVEKGIPVDYYKINFNMVTSDLDIANYLLEKGAKIDDDAISIAAGSNRLDLVKYLVEKGGKIGDAVSIASRHGNLDVVKYLVEKGGKISYDAVSNAARTGNLDLVEYLVEKSGKISAYAVSKAVGTGNLELVKYLVEKGGEISADAVIYAVETGNLELVEYLVEKGGKISADAVSVAAKINNSDLVEYLVEKGGKISYDAVSKAVVTGNLELVKYLVEKGGEISEYAVSYAAGTGNLELVKYLVEKGGEISDYAVSNAAYNGNLDLVYYLNSTKNRN